MRWIPQRIEASNYVAVIYIPVIHCVYEWSVH